MKQALPLLALLTLAGTGRADEAKPAAPAAPETKGEDLHALMKSIGKQFGPLAKSVGDASKIEANRKLAQDLAALTDKCAALIPAKAKAVPEAEREKFVAAYKAEIGKLAADFRKIDEALAKKDFAAAKAAVADAGALKKEDHPKFIKKR